MTEKLLFGTKIPCRPAAPVVDSPDTDGVVWENPS